MTAWAISSEQCWLHQLHQNMYCISPPRGPPSLWYKLMCQAMTQQVTGSSLCGNMLVFQACVLGSGQRFFCLVDASMALALSAHTPWVQFSVSCQCMLAHRIRVKAHLVGTWQERLAGTPVHYLLSLIYHIGDIALTARESTLRSFFTTVTA